MTQPKNELARLPDAIRFVGVDDEGVEHPLYCLRPGIVMRLTWEAPLQVFSGYLYIDHDRAKRLGRQFEGPLAHITQPYKVFTPHFESIYHGDIKDFP